MKAHGKAPNPQRRVQAAGFAGVFRRRDPDALSKRHDISCNLIRIWIEKFQAGALDDDAAAADLLQAYEPISHTSPSSAVLPMLPLSWMPGRGGLSDTPSAARSTRGWKTPAEVLDQFLGGQYDAGVATTG